MDECILFPNRKRTCAKSRYRIRVVQCTITIPGYITCTINGIRTISAGVVTVPWYQPSFKLLTVSGEYFMGTCHFTRFSHMDGRGPFPRPTSWCVTLAEQHRAVIGTTNDTSNHHNPAPYNHLGIWSGTAQPINITGQDDGSILAFYTSISRLPLSWDTTYPVGAESQSLAYSYDGGITWQHYAGNR